MNISKPQQRTLHALAQGARIELLRDDQGRIIAADCITREGWRLTDCTLSVFKALKKRRFIASSGGGPYRITREGAVNLRAQLDNRVSPRGW
ncbi:MAG: YjhX family toxin [Caulobacter sp.]|nr:YjhX family toxin [Caulobacter sp.]